MRAQTNTKVVEIQAPLRGFFIATEILAPHPIYLSLICCSGFCVLVYIHLDQALHWPHSCHTFRACLYLAPFALRELYCAWQVNPASLALTPPKANSPWIHLLALSIAIFANSIDEYLPNHIVLLFIFIVAHHFLFLLSQLTPLTPDVFTEDRAVFIPFWELVANLKLHHLLSSLTPFIWSISKSGTSPVM